MTRPSVVDITGVDAIRRAVLAEVRAEVYDLPIGDNLDYSRGYSAAIRSVRETIERLAQQSPPECPPSPAGTGALDASG